MRYNEHTDWICSLQAARTVLPALVAERDIRSVVDFGCGLSAWLDVAVECGATTVVGVDSDEESRATEVLDLCNPISLGMWFDLAICVEVGEHLPASAAETLVDTICWHSSLVLFSAATPGQGGDGHINEQPHEYWDDKFAARGYQLEPVDTRRVDAHWYRNNLRLFWREPWQS